jgi:Eukaryotic-type carbonic anhydrase
MGTVSVFMQAYEDAPPYPFIDKMICQWRRKEYEDRIACGLDPIDGTYPGCFPLRAPNVRRKTEENTQQRDSDNPIHRLKTFHDVILYNDLHKNDPNHTDLLIDMDESNWGPADEKDWDTWIQQQSDKMKAEEDLYNRMKNLEHGGNNTEQLHNQFRKLLQYDEIEYFNYWPMLGARTEYYFRYSGSQTIPPCYGNFETDSRTGTNHWRVMKDPIRIHPRQLRELERLVRERIAPIDDPVQSVRCKKDTAAKVDPTSGKVNTARPLQDWSTVHFKTFCECKDWPSKWPEDREWCNKNQDIDTRFYSKPYNFDTDGYQ